MDVVVAMDWNFLEEKNFQKPSCSDVEKAPWLCLQLQLLGPPVRSSKTLHGKSLFLGTCSVAVSQSCWDIKGQRKGQLETMVTLTRSFQGDMSAFPHKACLLSVYYLCPALLSFWDWLG